MRPPRSVFSAGNGNTISIADPDAGSAAVKVTASVSHGTLTPTTTSGVTITGSGTAIVQLTGALGPLNSALASLEYLSDPDFNSTRGTESLVIQTDDQGNTGAGGALIDTDSLSISVNPINDPPTAAEQTFGSADVAAVQTNMAASLTGLLAGATDPDSADGNFAGQLHVDSVSDTTSPAGGSVLLTDGDAGTFTFDPPPGVTGAVTFTYVIVDEEGLIDSATATVYVGGSTIWFAQAGASPGGTGALSSPFNSLAAAVTAIGTDTNERVFLYSGTYPTGITLKAGGWIVGQQATGASFDAVMGISPPAGTIARPAIATGTATVQSTVTLATGAKVQGIRIASTVSPGLVGTAGTGIDVSQTAVATTSGTALNLSTAQGNYSFSTVSTTSAANAILINNLGASPVTIAGGSISGASTRGIDINLGTGNFTYGGTVATSGTVARSVEVTSHTAGTVTFNGVVTDTSAGINLTGNTGATFNFAGGITVHSTTNNAFTASSSGTINLAATSSIDTTTGTGLLLDSTSMNVGGNGLVVSVSNGFGVKATGGAVAIGGANLTIVADHGVGFSAVDGGTVTVTGTGHTIDSSSQAALDISNTTIGAAGVTFQSISSTGGVNGIILDTTGSTAGLSVTGDGGECTGETPSCSGGLIHDTTGDGILLSDTQSPSFAKMHIQSTAGNGVDGTDTRSFAFNDGVIDNSGTDLGAESANISFGHRVSGTETNLAGVVTITGNTLTNAYFHGIDIYDFGGTISAAVISGNTITSDSSTSTSKGTGIRLAALGSATTVANVTRATISENTVTGFPSGSGILVSGGNENTDGSAGTLGISGSDTDIVAITDNTVAGFSSALRFGAVAIGATVRGNGQGNFDVSRNGSLGNPIRNSLSTAIAISSFGNADVTAIANDNVVVAHNSAGAPGISAETGRVFGVLDAPKLRIVIDSNNISQTDGQGILAAARDATGQLDVTITNNVVAAPLGANTNGIRIDAGTAASGNDSVCLGISGNTTSGSGSRPEGIALRKEGTVVATNSFGVVGMTAATSTPDVETFVGGQNTGSQINGATGLRVLLIAGSNFTNCSSAP